MDNQKYIKESIFSFQNDAETENEFTAIFEIQYTNEVAPVYDIKTLEINISGDNKTEACFSFSMDEFKSFKDYINKLYKHCKSYNLQSKENETNP